MEDQNIIILLDKIKKLLELGNKPKAILEIETTIIMLERKLAKEKGSRFTSLHIEQELPGVELSEHGKFTEMNRQKINEIIRFLNERFPVS